LPGQVQIIASIPLGSRGDVLGYYPRAIEIAPETILATDGMGVMFLVRDGNIIGRRDEEIPFVLLDVKVVDDQITLLLCQAKHLPAPATTSYPPKAEYLVRKVLLNLSEDLEYTLLNSVIGTEIPKHAVLTPDILLVSQSPFHPTTPSTDSSEEIDLDSESPAMYTYFQTDADLDISLPLPLVTPKHLIQVSFSTSTLKLQFISPTSPDHPDLSEFLPFQTSDEKPLWGIIDPMTSTWTLSTSPTGKTLEIHLQKAADEGMSRWPRVFEDEDDAEEYTDPSDRRGVLERLGKYTSNESRDSIKRKFLFEEDEDVDYATEGDIVQLFHDDSASRVVGHDVLAVPFDSTSIGLKFSIDMCCFNVDGQHVMTAPAFGFVSSSKRLRKYLRYTDSFSLIVESGSGGNMYVYYLPQNGITAKQIVVRLGLDSLGIGFISSQGVVVIGHVDNVPQAVLVTGL